MQIEHNDPQFKPGEPLSLEVLQHMADLTGRTERQSVAGWMGSENNSGGLSIYDQSPLHRWIRITGQSTGSGGIPLWYYDWEPVYLDYNQEWQVDDQCFTGSFSSFAAIEINENENIPNGLVVRAWMGDSGDCLLFDSLYGVIGTTGGSGLTVNYTGGSTVNIAGSTLNVDNTSTFVNAGNTVHTPSTLSTWTVDQTDLDVGFATRIRIAYNDHGIRLNSLVAIPGRVVHLHNVGTKVGLLTNEHAPSTAANRILTCTGNDFWHAPGHEVTLWCDPTSSRWRVSENSNERLGGTATYTLTTDTADFALTRDKRQHEITPDAEDWIITGFAGGHPGLRQTIINGSTAYGFMLPHNDVTSTAANRLFLPDGEPVRIPPNSACDIEYNGATSRWHLCNLPLPVELAEGRIGYGSATNELTGTLDLVRESEAVLRVRGSTGSAQPILRIQRNIEGVDLADGDIVGQRIFEPYYDSAYVECFEETIKHWETEATDKTAWEVKVGSGAADKSALKAGTNGKIIVSQAATADRLIGTGSTHAELINVALASPYLVLSGGTLTALCDLLSPLHAAEISVSSNTTATISRMHVLDGSGCTLTLPAVSGNTGKLLGIRIATSATGLMTIDGNSTELIDGEQTRIMWAGESAILLCNGTSWAKIAGKTIAMKCKCLNSKSLGSYDSIAHATVTVVPLDSTDHDNTGLMADLANDRITCRRSGVYVSAGFVGYCGSASAGGIGANATRLFASFPGAQPEVSAVSGSVPCIGAATTWSLTAGTTYQLTGYQTTGLTQYFYSGVSNFSLAEIPSW